MGHVFIISTSHQLLQLTNAIRHFNIIKENILVIIMISSFDKSNLLDEVNKLGITKVQTFEYWVFKEIMKPKVKKFLTFLQNVKYCENLYISQYFSDYSSLAYSILNPSKLYLMDEGTASFLVVKSRSVIRFINKGLLLKSLFYKVWLKVPKEIIYFTQYDIENKNKNDKIVKYNLEQQKNQIEFDDNSILILGSSITELEIVHRSLYFNILKRIIDSNHGKSIDYYPHRKENPEKIIMIEKLGINIIRNNLPFENYFLELNRTAHVYYSFYSPVLDNLSKLYESIPDVRVIKLDKVCLLKNQSIIENIYNSYSKNRRLNLVDIDSL